MLPKRPFFSIVIPSYNRADEVNAVLNTLLDQVHKNFEVVIVDDCSSDILAIEGNYPFSINLFRNKINLGAASSRNVGVDNAIGDWIVFLDDDDEFSNHKLSEIYKKICENDTLNFIYHKATCIMVHEKVVYETKPDNVVSNLSINNILQGNQVGGAPMIAIKKDYFLSLGGFNQGLKALEDYEFLIRVIDSEKFKPAYIDQALTVCKFYTRRKSVSKNYSATLDAWDYIEKSYKRRLKADKSLNRKFKKNKLKSVLFLQVVNLSRMCSSTLLKLFAISYNPIYLLMAVMGLISPKLLIYLRAYKN